MPTQAHPSHVPAHLVVDANIYALDGGETDPQMAWKALDIPGNSGLVWMPHNGGHWIATSASLIWTLFADIERLSARNLSVPPTDGPIKMIPNESDEPEHHHYRKIVLPFVSPKAVRRLTDQVREMTAELIDGFHARGRCEFMTDFARHVPMLIFLSLVHLPEDDVIVLVGRSLEDWSESTTGATPAGPEVDKDDAALRDRLFEVVERNSCGGHGCEFSAPEQAREEAPTVGLGRVDLSLRMPAITPIGRRHGPLHRTDVLPAPGPSGLAANLARDR